jgi:ABC-2 type transport system ATP-binding protein
MTATAIKLDRVTRRFGAITAVDELSLEVQAGEIFGLLGPNGAGKTTAINLMIGLLGRHGGEIAVMGIDPQKDARRVRKIIGLVPQETNLYHDLSAVDNMKHHAALYCADLNTVDRQIEAQMRLMDLWERRNDAVRTYSGGMKRRLALARTLLHDPEIIFFDEPTLGVDVQVRHILWEHIKRQQKEGKTFIISTNDMTEADRLCDRLVIIDHGKAITSDSPENLKAQLNRDIVTLRTEPQIETPERLFEGLEIQTISKTQPGTLRIEAANADRLAGEIVGRVTREHRLDSIRIARPTLDDVFLQHTGRALRE